MFVGTGKCKNHVVFSARCNRVGILPLSLRIRSPVGWRIAKKAGYQFLNERLRVANQKVRHLEEEKELIDGELRGVLSGDDYHKLVDVSRASAEKAFVQTRERQKAKFERLLAMEGREQGVREKIDREKWVVNLSQRNLSQQEKKVLQLGMKFAPAQRRIPKLEMVARVEDALQSCDKPAEVDKAMAAIANAMKVARLPRGNVRKTEWQAVSDLRKDENIVILESDKGNATVVLDSEEYERKAL